MEFKELLAAFAAKYKIEDLNEVDGAAVLAVDGIPVELLDEPQTQSMLACAEIGFPPPDANGSYGALMLKANFMLHGTEGATLCQNPDTGAYAIVRTFPLALTDAVSLGNGLESLVNQAEDWRKILSGMRVAEEARLKVLKTGDSHHEMISNGFFHV